VTRSASTHPPDSDRAQRVAGRYRILSELAAGGMGTVYAALDESTGARIALKRLGTSRKGGSTRRKGAPDADVALRFQLEYAMLSRLRHPSIIDVHEYGIDRGTPYYTMELLDGQDLREVAPAPYREACRHVRDVASSLALLHAHRLVHRDVSPRNVRLTAEGRSKLFDFGTLTPFGAPPDIAGTPSCVPPEALNGSSLDHRADLYSLGSVLYWLLTVREAFPARRLDDLPSILDRMPPPPSAFAECPAELDALVMAMLHRDPLARPSSAAEVIERLDAVGRLEPEPQHDVVHGYVLSAKTVGRASEMSELGQAIERVFRRQGGGVLLTGERGIGKTRVVREAALQAQLRGATVLFVDTAAHEGPYEAAAQIGKRLLQASPLDAVLCGGRYAKYACHLVPELAERVGPFEPAEPTDALGDFRARLHASLEGWVTDFAERRPLVVIVDDIDRADEGSVRLLASLAREGANRRLAIIATARTDRAAKVPPGAFATEMKLAPLDGEAVSELAHSLFGDAPHVRRFAQGLHEKSRGSPACCMELVTHLVDQRVVRYAGGAWMLPEASLVDALSASLEGASAARLTRLRPAVRSFAEALSVASTALPLSLCLWLAHADAGREPRGAMLLLDELVTEGVLTGSAGQYRFADEVLRQTLRAGLSEERGRKLHRKLGEALVRSSRGRPFDSITAGWHLLRGGDEGRGAQLLATAARRMILETDDLRAAVPALEAALDVYRDAGRLPHELSFLVGPLASAGYSVDFRLATRYGPEALRLFSIATGLRSAIDLTPSLGRSRALAEGVARAVMERRRSADAEQVSTHELFEMFFRCALSLAGVYSVCIDAQGLRNVSAALEPLSGLGAGHPGTWLHRHAGHLREMCEGRYAAAEAGLTAIIEAFAEGAAWPAPLAFPSRRLLVGSALFALGAMATLREGDDAPKYADRLGSLGLDFYDMVGDQLRMVHYAHQGDAARARKLRDSVDARAMARGSAWQLEVWEVPAMLLVHVRENDVMGLKIAAERLDVLAQEIPSFQRLAVIARAAHLRLRGELPRAEELLENIVYDASAPRFLGLPTAIGLLAEVYNIQGDFTRAERITSELKSRIGEEDRLFSRTTLPAQIQHAHAVAGLGGADAARAELEGLMLEHAGGQDRVTLGLLHRARAELALSEGDAASFDSHLAAMERLFRPTANPALVAMCERLRHEFRRNRTASSGEFSVRQADDVSSPRRVRQK
jgi:hypothetical protein